MELRTFVPQAEENPEVVGTSATRGTKVLTKNAASFFNCTFVYFIIAENDRRLATSNSLVKNNIEHLNNHTLPSIRYIDHN